ncbi:MAG: DUF4910 domain-containing protein [Mariniblastus sp.]|nr:DUF4910 domain-containing protein [Mariniblastus sp.]
MKNIWWVEQLKSFIVIETLLNFSRWSGSHLANSLDQKYVPGSENHVGQQMHRCITQLFPYHRSNAGVGLRQTLSDLQDILPIKVHEVPTGTKVFDWEVPQEWRIKDAFIADEAGQRIVDYCDSNLAVMSGSLPIRARMRAAELRPNLLTLKEELNPDWVPYRTAFFRDAWAFCVSHKQWARLNQDDQEVFNVVIDSEFIDGSLTYGEVTIEGQTKETILVYAHCCHPSLANDNLSGVAVAAFLGKQLLERVARGDIPFKTYKIVFAPATIGAITWLAQNEKMTANITGGLILSLLGDAGGFTFKQSRVESSVNRAVELVMHNRNTPFEMRPFSPFGYDERQFCSPGINLPMGCFMRTPNGEFPEYHTSADNLEFVSPEALADSLDVVTEILATLEQNFKPVNLHPFCEPQLGNRGLYRAFGEHDDRGRFQEAVMWILNQADGTKDLLAIAKHCELPMKLVREAADVLVEHELLGFSEA